MSAGIGRSPLTLLDWRRRMFAIYADVRAESDTTTAHARWRSGRDALFATHPDSPLSEERQREFAGLPVAPYDPSMRFVSAIDDAPAERREVPTGTDGVVPFERVGRVRLGDLGTSRRVAARVVRRWVVRAVTRWQRRTDDVRRWPLRARHREGRRPRRGPEQRHARRRLELRVPPVLRLRPGVGVPAGAAGQRAQRRGRRRRATAARRLVLSA